MNSPIWYLGISLYSNDEYKYAIDDFINWCINIFGQDNFYRITNWIDSDEQKDYNKKAIQIAKFMVLNDSYQ